MGGDLAIVTCLQGARNLPPPAVTAVARNSLQTTLVTANHEQVIEDAQHFHTTLTYPI